MKHVAFFNIFYIEVLILTVIYPFTFITIFVWIYIVFMMVDTYIWDIYKHDCVKSFFIFVVYGICNDVIMGKCIL